MDRLRRDATLAGFDEHLRRTRGVCAGTRRNYARFVRVFLQRVFADASVDVAKIHPRDVFSYGVAKAGVNSLTQYLARELVGDGIRVNALVPGFFPAEQNRKVLTAERVASIVDHTALRRLGTPEELDGALLWLASARASGFVTGALVRIDGGFSAMTI